MRRSGESVRQARGLGSGGFAMRSTTLARAPRSSSHSLAAARLTSSIRSRARNCLRTCQRPRRRAAAGCRRCCSLDEVNGNVVHLPHWSLRKSKGHDVTVVLASVASRGDRSRLAPSLAPISLFLASQMLTRRLFTGNSRGGDEARTHGLLDCQACPLQEIELGALLRLLESELFAEVVWRGMAWQLVELDGGSPCE